VFQLYHQKTKESQGLYFWSCPDFRKPETFYALT